MHWIMNKLRMKLGIVRIEKKLTQQTSCLVELQKIIKKHTSYNLDVHQVENSQVILIGKYRNADFVHCYSIKDNDFSMLIQQCKELEKYSHRNKIDAWPSFKATINNELSQIGY